MTKRWRRQPWILQCKWNASLSVTSSEGRIFPTSAFLSMNKSLNAFFQLTAALWHETPANCYWYMSGVSIYSFALWFWLAGRISLLKGRAYIHSLVSPRCLSQLQNCVFAENSFCHVYECDYLSARWLKTVRWSLIWLESLLTALDRRTTIP